MINTIESNKIELPKALAEMVWEELKKGYGIKALINRMRANQCAFTREELALVKILDIKNPQAGCLEGISLLPNLEELRIQSDGNTAYKQDEEVRSITDEDMLEIARCEDLLRLNIKNQAFIHWVDVRRLKNLESLTLSHNNHLEEVLGLDGLTTLNELHCYGNNRLTCIPHLAKAILSNKDLDELNLDVLLFPEAIRYNIVTGEYSQEVLDRIREIIEMGDVSWLEKMGYSRFIRINHSQMKQLHNRACEILYENVPESSPTRDIILAIERYLAEHVVYDTESVRNNHTNTVLGKNGVRLAVGPAYGANGAYNALMKNTCVCEGYTRAEQYLLKLKGIYARNVDCYPVEDFVHMADPKQDLEDLEELFSQGIYTHSIVCIEDYYGLYSDPCWNARKYQKGNKTMPWSLRTKQEISWDHTLSFDEQAIENNWLAQPRRAIAKSIKDNVLFRKAKASSINDVKGIIQTQVKGQVREGGIEI